MFALSTCWNANRHTDGRAMLSEIRQLGFEAAELSHNTRISLVPGIIEAVDKEEIQISSLHNFCPLPMGINHAAPNLYQFTAERPRERELAERYTLKTIEFAARVRAPVVVLHLGSIGLKNYTDRMLEMVASGARETPKYARLSADLDAKREALKEPCLDRIRESLKKLLPEVESRGIKLAIENRQGLEELPFESDFQFLFRDLPSPNLVYWHDTGHAQIKENLGFMQHAMLLESLREHLCGFHIHDVQFPGRDHRPPGSGTIDFAALKRWVKPEDIKVFELDPSLTVEQAKGGVEHVKRLWAQE
jgi:sugar phosphate isomerase/epimerase